MKMIAKRLIGALWPLLFIPLIMMAVKSKFFGEIDYNFEIDEALFYVAAIYAAVYCGFWFWGKEHGMSTVGAALITVAGVTLWQILFPIAESTLN